MSHNGEKMAARTRAGTGPELDARYLRYFDCFNQQLYYEAHAVLEELWLPTRQGPDGSFYKGLIQLAAAFFHLQKGRLGPAASLFRLARANLEKYPGVHARLALSEVLATIDDWHPQLEAGASRANPFLARQPPRLRLSGSG